MLVSETFSHLERVCLLAEICLFKQEAFLGDSLHCECTHPGILSDLVHVQLSCLGYRGEWAGRSIGILSAVKSVKHVEQRRGRSHTLFMYDDAR